VVTPTHNFPILSIQSTQRYSGVPIITITNKNSHLPTLLDTGAQYSLIDYKSAKLLNPKFHPSKQLSLTCANGTKFEPFGKLKLTLHFNSRSIIHEFIVMDKMILPCIIGADIMSQYDLIPRLRKGYFYFGDQPNVTFPISEIVDNYAKILLSIKTSSVESVLEEEYIEKRVQELLEKYPTVARNDGSFGCTDWTFHEILSTGSPKRLRPRRYSPAMREEIRKQVKQMLQNGVIRPSISPWAAQIVLDQKKNGEWRFCVDYSQLNSITQDNAGSMETTQGILRNIPQGYWYSVIDLNSGYWQIQLAEESIPKSAFACQEGLFEFLVMPFGLKNAPKTFQNLMRRVLDGYLDVFCRGFLDDILIYSATFEEHIHHIELVLHRLKAAKLTISRSKCKFARREVDYLGHRLTQTGIVKQKDKLRAITEFPTPVCKKDVQSFLGLCQWYGTFIAHLAEKSEPLRKLERKDSVWKWGEEQEKAFQELKSSLCEDVLLTGIDYSMPLILKCDASDFGLGAVLVNVVDEVERPICFISKLLKKQERNAHIYEKEVYAIIWAYDKLREFIQGHKFTIQTDNRAVKYIKSTKITKSKLKRWSIEIDSWGADIIHRPGKENIEADILSRNPVIPLKHESDLFSEANEIAYVPFCMLFGSSITREKLIDEQNTDEEIRKIKDQIMTIGNAQPIGLYKIEDGILKRKIVWDFRFHLDEIEINQEAKPGSLGLKTYPKNHSDDILVESEIHGCSDSDRYNPKQQLSITNGSNGSGKDKHDGVVSVRFDTMSSGTAGSDQPDNVANSNEADPIISEVYAYAVAGNKRTKEYFVPVIPASLTKEILFMFHDVPTAGHLGVTKTLNKIKERCFWKGMNKDIRDYIKSCQVCQETKALYHLPYGLMHSIHPPSKVFDVLNCDFMGPFPTSSGGHHKYLFVVVDELSKWVELFPMSSATAKKVVEVLEDQIFCRFGIPSVIVSDNASQFISKTLQIMCKQWGVKHRFSSAYHAQVNKSERTNRNLKPMLQAYIEDNHKTWDRHLQKFAFALRSSVNDTTQVSPALLNLGRNLPQPFDRQMCGEMLCQQEEDVSELSKIPEKLTKIITWVRGNMIKASESNKVYYDQSHRDHRFKTGDLVMIKNHQLSKKADNIMQKLTKRWDGPFQLGKKCSEVSFELLTVPDGKVLLKRHVSELKPYCKRPYENFKPKPSPKVQDLFSNVTNNDKVGEDIGRVLRRRQRVNYRTLAGYGIKKRNISCILMLGN